MTTVLTWHDIALRLVAAAIAAALIGFDRTERGRSAGLRTNLLVSLAACIAMIQANVLINSNGRPSDSYVAMDIMRLPLGILSGIGFIGAGAIIKRGQLTLGITTAATLWFVTVMGLCFGGGQYGLGAASCGLGLLVISGLKKFEVDLSREQRASLRITMLHGGPQPDEIETIFKQAGIGFARQSLVRETSPVEATAVDWQLHWRDKPHREVPLNIEELATRSGVAKLELARRAE